MVRSVDKQVRRESLERELRTVRSAIRTFREAAETAQDQSVMFQLERAEEKEVQLLEAPPTWTRTRARTGRPRPHAEAGVDLREPRGTGAAARAQLECKSPSQVMPERGCISRETAGLLRTRPGTGLRPAE